jgi:UDP-2,3-diacylglucosamine pyrophosphatase LpxH
MLTEKRLTQAYKQAKIEHFDKNSKYIFFSDCHRGDDSVSDEFTRNQNLFLHALNYYYDHGYFYVEAGDGDELWEYKKFKYIRIAHSDVFLAMKKFFDDKRFIMMYGNHNIYLASKNYVRQHYYNYYDENSQEIRPLFQGLNPIGSLVLKHKKTGQEILIVHGHQGDYMNDQLWELTMLLLRYFWKFMHLVGFQNPTSPARNLYKRHKVEKAYKKWICNHKMMLICGHTHRQKFPNKDDLPYFNTGCCTRTKGITGIEILEDHVLLAEWRVRSDADGVMRIYRNVIRGPEPISSYDFNLHRFKEDPDTDECEID